MVYIHPRYAVDVEKRMTKQKRLAIKSIRRLEDIPAFANESDEADYWDRHTLGPGLLAGMKPAHPETPTLRRQRATSIAIRLDTALITRLRALAALRGIGYQTLLKELVARGVAEEEHRGDGVDEESATEAVAPHCISIEDIPEHLSEFGPCPFCGEPVAQAPVDYRYPVDRPVIQHAGPLPGYKCSVCEAEYLPPELNMRLEQKALDYLQSANMVALAMPLQHSLERWHQLIKR